MLVCNGPSLNQTDFTLVRKEVSMGMNKIYLGFQRFRFYPRYYVATNQHVITQSAYEIRRLNCIRFLRSLGDASPLPESALTYFLRSTPEPQFQQNLCTGFFEGYTVTFAALQIAFFMGFTEVVIVGMDHRYSFHGLPNEPHELKGEDRNHFDPSYFSGQTWDNPDLASSERFYYLARQTFEAAGRRIIDCTIDGACSVFEKGGLKEALQ
ncbi:hypothetical protein VB737_09785 [Synechococcus sp. BA-120 BA3]|nr:hypothetical protein [Synechococcus sp. BA-120 BA3]